MVTVGVDGDPSLRVKAGRHSHGRLNTAILVAGTDPEISTIVVLGEETGIAGTEEASQLEGLLIAPVRQLTVAFGPGVLEIRISRITARGGTVSMSGIVTFRLKIGLKGERTGTRASPEDGLN